MNKYVSIKLLKLNKVSKNSQSKKIPRIKFRSFENTHLETLKSKIPLFQFLINHAQVVITRGNEHVIVT